MAANKKPRKKYRPRGVFKDPLAYVMAGNRPATEEAQLKAKIGYHLSMTNITQGRGRKEDWQEITNSINLGLTLCEMGYGKEFVPDLVKAQGAMILLRDRFKSSDRMILKAEEMSLINTALDLHDQQLALAPIREVEKAIRHVEQQIARGNFVTLQEIQQGHPLTAAAA